MMLRPATFWLWWALLAGLGFVVWLRGFTPLPAAPPPAEIRVDLNQADTGDWLSLPGIGPALASRILQARQDRGGFDRVEDLLAVRGIGPKIMERLRPLVKTEPSTPMKEDIHAEP